MANSPERTRPAEKMATGGLLVRDVADTTRALNGPDSTVEKDLEILQAVIEFYRRTNDGKNPAGGLNAEIVGQLLGGNQKRVAVIPPNHPSLNAEGELLDRWGTPYFFHPVSSEILEIRSAGPDRELWTADDREIGTAPTVADE